MKPKQIKIVFVAVGESPVVMVMENKLEAMQKLVGGYIEILEIAEGLDLVCNEEGKLDGLKPNHVVGDDIIVGDFFVTRVDYKTGEHISITDDDLDTVEDMFGEVA